MLAQNPLQPAYRDDLPVPQAPADLGLDWIEFDGGVREIGHGGGGFAFDCEGPRHRVWVRPFRLASRPVANREFLAFVEDGGYDEPAHWLAPGIDAARDGGWRAPLYWRRDGDGWREFTLGGPRPLDLNAPVGHVSFFEADAYARWAGRRLPREAEWEVAAAALPPEGNLLARGLLHPAPSAAAGNVPAQMFGDVWEWTACAYAPYPGFRPAAGAVGEYNGKFMSGRMVLRGGSCATPPGHIRATYRNFFGPSDRWQFSGLRLADDR